MIKSYSPELIVHPYLPESSAADEAAAEAAADKARGLQLRGLGGPSG